LTPLKDDCGRITHFVSTGKDITERISAEETLRESEARLSKAQRLAGVGSFEWCLETNELSWSDELNRIYGLNPQEASPSFELFMSVVHPEDRQTIKEAIDESLRERKPFNLDHRIIRPDGTLRILHCEAEVTGDELNNPLRMVGVCQDITERKRLEDELGQARRMEAVGRLAGGIAHDFNNLLTGILGYTELVLLRLKPVDPLRKEVEEIQKAGNRAAALTSQLLAYSRRQVLQPKILDLNTVIRDMQKMLCRMIGEDISFAANLATDLGYVKADPGQIGQVLMNLSVNARDAMPHGGELSIETANIDLAEPDETMDLDLLPGRYVTVRFTDTGTGIESDVLPYIFEPFFTTKEKDKGTGLGLSTVYGIIKQSGGDVIVESQAGLGTTFTIYLPRAVEEGTAEYRSRIADTQPLADETILLVEDDKLVRDLALNILDDLGYNVLSATDGKDALRVNEENSGVKIDLLLTDMVMPQMNGHELYQALAQSRPAIKVLFMSGYMDEDIMAKTALVEGSAFIQKPFSLDDLARKIRETLGT
jgi:PAS domain S-box-containing protein